MVNLWLKTQLFHYIQIHQSLQFRRNLTKEVFDWLNLRCGSQWRCRSRQCAQPGRLLSSPCQWAHAAPVLRTWCPWSSQPSSDSRWWCLPLTHPLFYWTLAPLFRMSLRLSTGEWRLPGNYRSPVPGPSWAPGPVWRRGGTSHPALGSACTFAVPSHLSCSSGQCQTPETSRAARRSLGQSLHVFCS